MGDTKELVGRLEMVPIRKVFHNEARDFTVWLETHIEALGDRVGIDLSSPQREKEVGDFTVDILCEDGDGHPVIVENQLEKTDHDHLGKFLTYLVNLDARTAIWVSTEPRAEHMKVINWLNESTSEDLAFYLVKVEATRIGESPYAPLFTVLAGPDKQVKRIGEKKKEWAERHHKRLEFWKSLLERCREQTKLFSNISPSRYHWIGTGAGKAGVTFNFAVLSENASVELYIDHDHDEGKKNKAIFDALHAQKDQIEKDYGGTLGWERLDEKRACRIKQGFDDGGLSPTESWPELQDKMIDAMVRLDKALRRRLAKVQV